MARKKRDTSKKRAEIVAAAIRAFQADGYDNTSMDRIAEVARIWDRALRARPPRGDAVLDASGVEYCDGAGMGLIHEMTRRQRCRGDNLRVDGLREDLAEFLQHGADS